MKKMKYARYFDEAIRCEDCGVEIWEGVDCDCGVDGADHLLIKDMEKIAASPYSEKVREELAHLRLGEHLLEILYSPTPQKTAGGGGEKMEIEVLKDYHGGEVVLRRGREEYTIPLEKFDFLFFHQDDGRRGNRSIEEIFLHVRDEEENLRGQL